MPLFPTLEDTPMFRKRLHQLEERADILKGRSHKLLKGSRKYADSLSEASAAELAFAKTIDAFATAGGLDDPTSIEVGGPVMARFVEALRELRSYKDVLKTQVDHMLVDRVSKFKDFELQHLRDVRKKVERSSHLYDQARERFLSLKKDARPEIVFEAENELQVAKINYEQARFAFASAVSSIESKKKYEYVESVASTLDAHLRFFKQGYELLRGLEPFIQQVLTFSQQAREAGQLEQAAFTAQVEDYLQAQQREQEGGKSNGESVPGQGPYQPVGGASQKEVEEVMAASALRGRVQNIRQGYLLKRSSNIRGDWQRRFFVLDSRGMLYYYRKGSVLSFKQPSSTPQSSPPLIGHGQGLAAGSGPGGGVTPGSVQSFLQTGMQGLQSGVSSVSSLLMRGNNSANPTASGGYAASEPPGSPDTEPPTPTSTSAAASSANAPASSGGFSVFSRVLNPRKDSLSSVLPWRGFGSAGGKDSGGALGPLPSDSSLKSELSFSGAEPLPMAESYSLLSSADSVSSTPRSSPPRESGSALGGTPSGHLPGEERRQDCHMLSLLTATIKMDAEQSDLRFCFRIVTPLKTYTLQAENAAERMDWVDKITAVISSLLNAQLLGAGPGGGALGLSSGLAGAVHGEEWSGPLERPVDMLQAVPGNGGCVDCGRMGPDWASLNLGVLMCIECSGIHRNLGVQVSKVRSLTLDVRVWEEAPVIAFFRATGNAFANSMWEEGLSNHMDRPGSPPSLDRGEDEGEEEAGKERGKGAEEEEEEGDVNVLAKKPQAQDPIQVKEKFIVAKYVERRFLPAPSDTAQQVSRALWQAVLLGDIQKGMRLLVAEKGDVNTRWESSINKFQGLELEAPKGEAKDASTIPASSPSLQSVSRNQAGNPHETRSFEEAADPDGALPSPIGFAKCPKFPPEEESEASQGSLEKKVLGLSKAGWSLLHLACSRGDLGSVEMLLQHGAQIDAQDGEGRTPLHCALLCGHMVCAKHLVARGANAHVQDKAGDSPLESFTRCGGLITDEALLAALA